METLFEFDEPLLFDRDRLRDRLAGLAARNIRIGGSSWKYEGWLNQIYRRSQYLTRGRFSKKLFEETCIQEYATVFPTVCGDFAFYQFPTPAFWARLFQQVGPGFLFAFKVPEQVTVPVWPVHTRYGSLAGLVNPTFFDVRLFEEGFLQAIAPYRRNVGVLIFEFGTFREQVFASCAEFVRALDPFLAQLPKGWRYAVEIRNAEFLTPEYFGCLREHGIAHVFNAWTRMPELADQMRLPGSQTADFLVSRALLRQGRSYEDAVREFAPYSQIRDVNELVRRGLRDLIDIAEVDGMPAFIYINNRLEGNSPGTIVAITD